METHFVAPGTMCAASICVVSNSFALYKNKLSKTTSEYSITDLVKEK